MRQDHDVELSLLLNNALTSRKELVDRAYELGRQFGRELGAEPDPAVIEAAVKAKLEGAEEEIFKAGLARGSSEALAALPVERVLTGLVGAASMCWNPTPSGVFDSMQAIARVHEAMAELGLPPPMTQAQMEGAAVDQLSLALSGGSPLPIAGAAVDPVERATQIHDEATRMAGVSLDLGDQHAAGDAKSEGPGGAA